MACITALTVQSTQGVRRVEPVAAETVRETLEGLAADVEIAAIHIGMLGKADIVATVSRFLLAANRTGLAMWFWIRF